MTQKNKAAGRYDAAAIRTAPVDDTPPFVNCPEWVQHARRVEWGSHNEDNLLLVLEANRRFMLQTGDQRRADLLTMAWASMEGGLS